MNRFAQWMMRLYPARWRKRYGDELAALLADTGADTQVVLDLLRGGIRMQFSTWSFAKLAVVLGIGGLVLGAGGSFLVTPVYVSKATLRVEAPDGDGLSPAENRARLTDDIRRTTPPVLSRSSLSTMINDPSLLLYLDELKVKSLESVIEKMQNDIRIDPADNVGNAEKPAVTVDVSFQYHDPLKARATVAALIERVEEQSKEMQDDVSGATTRKALNIVDVASLPVQPLYPIGNIAVLAGLAGGLLFPFLWLRIRKTGFVARRFVLSTVVFGMLGTSAGCAIEFIDIISAESASGSLLGDRYRSSALMSAQNCTPAQIQRVVAEALSRTSLSGIINDPHLQLYARERKSEPLEDVIQIMRQHLTITPDATGHFVTIAFVYRNRFRAQQAVQMMMSGLYDTSRRLHDGLTGQAADQPISGTFTTVAPPSTPVLPVKPNRYMMTGTGGAGGLLVAGVVALVRRRWQPEEDLPLDAVNG